MAVESLRRLPLFEGLSPEKTLALQAVAQRRSFKRGEIIFHKGDPGATLFLILHGQVKIVLPSDGGDEAVLAVLDEGDFFGELSLLDEEPRSATVVATIPTQTLVLHREQFLVFLMSNPDQAIALLKVLCHRLRETDQFVEDAVFLDVSGRLAKKLLELGKTYGQPSDSGTLIGMQIGRAHV